MINEETKKQSKTPWGVIIPTMLAFIVLVFLVIKLIPKETPRVEAQILMFQKVQVNSSENESSTQFIFTIYLKNLNNRTFTCDELDRCGNTGTGKVFTNSDVWVTFDCFDGLGYNNETLIYPSFFNSVYVIRYEKKGNETKRITEKKSGLAVYGTMPQGEIQPQEERFFTISFLKGSQEETALSKLMNKTCHYTLYFSSNEYSMNISSEARIQ